MIEGQPGSEAKAITPEMVTEENVKAFLEGAFAPVDVKETITKIKEFAAEVAYSARMAAKEMREKPIHAAAVGATIFATLAGQALDARQNASRAAFVGMGEGQRTTLAEESSAAPAGAIAQPTVHIPGLAGEIPYTGVTEVDLADVRAIPRTAEVEVDPDVETKRDFLPPLPFSKDAEMPAPLPPEQSRFQGLIFDAYVVKQDDTLSDIIHDQIYGSGIDVYKDNRFTDEYITAAKDIWVRNIVNGHLKPIQISSDGTPVGLTPEYMESNVDVSRKQQINDYIVRINDILKEDSRNLDETIELINQMPPELMPHLLRYLRVGDVLELPDYKATDARNQQTEAGRRLEQRLAGGSQQQAPFNKRPHKQPQTRPYSTHQVFEKRGA